MPEPTPVEVTLPPSDDPSSPGGRRRSHAGFWWPLATAGALGGLVLLGLSGHLDGLTLDTDRIRIPLALASLVLVPVVVVRRSARWWLTRVLPIVAIAVVFEGVLAWYLRVSATITDHYPPSFLWWIGIALVTAGTAVAGWRRAAPSRRVVALLAVPVSVATAFVLINSHYGYWPQLGDLLGHPVTGQVSADVLRRELADGSRAGHEHSHGVGHGQVALGPDLRRDVGQYAVIDIPATVSHFRHRNGGVYLPPAYFSPARDTLPVIIMLAGTPSGPSTLATAGGALTTANAYAADHDGVAPVILFPDANGSWTGDTECVNGPRGAAETYLTVDVVHFAEHVLHVTDDPQRWAILGFSEGGTCALDLSLRHPKELPTFVDLAGDGKPNVVGSTLRGLYGGKVLAEIEHEPQWLMAKHRYPDLVGWLGAGERDPHHLAVMKRQAAQAWAAGIDATWFEGPGAHGFQFCTYAIRLLMPQLMARLDAGAMPISGATPVTEA
jgi:S-formylglutathione hydrolase FrmB